MNPFLDTEARLDDGPDDDDLEGDDNELDDEQWSRRRKRQRLDAFIRGNSDNDDDDDGTANASAATTHQLTVLPPRRTEHFLEVVDHIAARFTRPSRGHGTSSTGQTTTTPTTLDTDLPPPLLFSPLTPKFRLSCHAGAEAEAARTLDAFLDDFAYQEYLQHVHDGNDIPQQTYGAFCVPGILGTIFVCCPIDDRICSSAPMLPGFVGERSIRWERLYEADWVRYQEVGWDTAQSEGDWVRVTQGRYKDEIALVAEVEYGMLHVLLLPRITPQGSAAHSPSLYNLFNPQRSYREFSRRQVLNTQFGNFLAPFRGLTVFTKEGLQLLRLPAASVTSDGVSAPLSLLTLFKDSSHPTMALAKGIQVKEWDLKPGELISPYDAQPHTRLAVVREATSNGVEVDYLYGGSAMLPWWSFLKYFKEGDHVVEYDPAGKTTREGFVTQINGAWVTVWTGDKDTEYVTHCNKLSKVSPHVSVEQQAAEMPPPLAASAQSSRPQPPHLMSTPAPPWIGIQVYIVKGVLKGHLATVKDVSCRQACASGVLVHLSLDQIGSQTSDIVVDFSHVRTTHDLRFLDQAFPLTARQRRFYLPKRPTPSPDEAAEPAQTESSERSVTPPPLNPITDGSIWDPSSATPLPPCSDTGFELPFWLIGLASHGKSFSVIYTGNTLKGYVQDQPVSVVVDFHETASYTLVEKRRTRTYPLPCSSSAKPHHPTSPSKSRDLMIVIDWSTEHIGKYVRRYAFDQETEMVHLAVVDKDGDTEVLCDECISLPAISLCVVPESKQERKLGNSLVEELRQKERPFRFSLTDN